MKKILISAEALGDLNEGFLFYEAQELGLGDYFIECLRADIEGLKATAGIHREVQGFYRLLSKVFPHGVFYTVALGHVTVWAVLDLRQNPHSIKCRLSEK